MKTTQPSHIIKVDKSVGREEPEMRRIRAQLRLSANWIVESKEVVRRLRDYSDEYPDSLDDHPDGPEDGGAIRSSEIAPSISVTVRGGSTSAPIADVNADT